MDKKLQISKSDSLIGAIACEYVIQKFKHQLADKEFRGAFHVLSGFTGGQLAGFIKAKELNGQRTAHIQIQFPEFALTGYDVDAACLTHESAVGVRNQNRGNGLIVLTAEVEDDAEASLADSDRTDASDLKDKSLANIWVEFVARSVQCTLLEEDIPKVEALLKGLFDTGRCPTAKVGEYLHGVLEAFKTEPLEMAAGRLLPIIGLPRSQECFCSLNEDKKRQASQWSEKFKSQYAHECYLDKRGRSGEPLDVEKLRETLRTLRSEDHKPPIQEGVLKAFEDYISSDEGRSPATENLLFSFDWSETRYCFDKSNRSSSLDFCDRTKKALLDDGVLLTSEDNVVIDALKKVGRRPGSAPTEFREFFERHLGALEKEARLFIEWEDFIHGKKVECTDLVQGIFECLERTIKMFKPGETARIELIGKDQNSRNKFLDRNQKACEYFERAYRSLEARTNRAVRFAKTEIFNYSSDVLPEIKGKSKFNGSKKSAKSLCLEFTVAVYKVFRKDEEMRVASLVLVWKFPFESVLAQEVSDFDAIHRYYSQRRTALVECYAEYEGVGRKGVPVPLSLERTEGFADVVRGGGRGAFVPAQDRIKSIAAGWNKLIEEGNTKKWWLGQEATELNGIFSEFHEKYNSSITKLRFDAMAHDHTLEMAELYRRLILAANKVQNQEARRRILRLILSIGLAQLRREGARPAVSVVCPWHPLRLEASYARQTQCIKHIKQLLSPGRPPFSDGAHGQLFFKEVEQLFSQPLYPEMAVVWEQNEPSERILMQSFGSYSLHQPAKLSDTFGISSLDNSVALATSTIEREITEYLRLQPHERDNFSILLYNCDSAALPLAVVDCVNRINAKRGDDKIMCQVLLMHRNEELLRQIYRDLVTRSVEMEDDPTEGTGHFLAKVRVNITAPTRLRRLGRSQPADIAYCRDLVSRQSEPVWEWIQREIIPPENLYPHQWARRLPVSAGDHRVLLQLVCPAQTDAGWAYLYAIAELCTHGAENAWNANKCPVLMKKLDFENQDVDRIFRETHELAVWVVNQDELLDRKLLEARGVKVIRYMQSATQGRNLVISSNARDTLLSNTLKEKMKAILLDRIADGKLGEISKRLMEDANRISGGLVLKAARRANNTNELLGMVLSRFLVQSEIGTDRAVAWCFLDDFSQWLGKKEGAQIADLLVLAPVQESDGSLRLDIVVTEAKFIKYDGLGSDAATSEKQLADTLSQITEALDFSNSSIDQDIWLARLSDLLTQQINQVPGNAELDLGAWRRAIRERRCSFRVWGYSHVFVYEPTDLKDSVSLFRGIVAKQKGVEIQAGQEIFGPSLVRELCAYYLDNQFENAAQLRLKNGNILLNQSNIRTFRSESTVEKESTESGLSGDSSEIKSGLESTGDNESVSSTSNSEPETPLASDQSKAQFNSVKLGAQASTLLQYLETKSLAFSSSSEEGIAWLQDMGDRLRRALISRGLTAKPCEGIDPILTPNAGIIKLQGTKELTVQSVEARSSEIFTSEGIEIISVLPESGRISIAVKRPVREVLHTEKVLLQYLNDFDAAKDGDRICIGVAEEDGRLVMLDPSVQPHTLVAGITGSGKSILIQNLLLTIAASRTPDEAHIYLIDPKFGLDYRPLEDLPHVRNGSGSIVDDPSEAIEILKSLVGEMDGRYRIFKEAGVPNIQAYRRLSGKSMPTLWVIHDEFTDWMMIEEYRKLVPDIVNRISVKARAAGIYLIFAAQRPDKDAMPMQLRSQLGNRLILKVDNEATSEIALGVKNGGCERLLGQGHMLVRNGGPYPIYAQVPFIDIERAVPEIVKIIAAQFPLQKPKAA